MVSHTAKLGVKLIVLPQHFNASSWLPTEIEARESAAGVTELISRMQQLSITYGCVIVLPILESIDGKILSNAVLIGPDGDIIGRQSQVHLEPELRSFCEAGTEFTVFETPFGRVGILIGYDGLFPESSRVLSLAGADVIAWCSAWRNKHDRKLLTVPKAEDNRVYLVCANRTDAPYPGGSLVIPPNGFPQWDLDIVSPRVIRHGAVMPSFMNLALARQKSMIPKVDMLRNRLIETYEPIIRKIS